MEGSVRSLIWVLIGLAGVTACSKARTPTSPTPPAQTTCTYAISTTSFSMSGAGGTGTFTVTTAPTCTWSVTNSASFVTVNPTTTQTGTGSVSFSIGENPGDTRTATLTIAGQSVTISQAPNDQLFGNWAGTISKGNGCPSSLPSSVEWTGTFRRTSGATTELVFSLPTVGIFNQVIQVALNGSDIQFFVPIDTLYTFNARLAPDRRSLTGTFAGGTCSGTWSGSRR